MEGRKSLVNRNIAEELLTFVGLDRDGLEHASAVPREKCFDDRLADVASLVVEDGRALHAARVGDLGAMPPKLAGLRLSPAYAFVIGAVTPVVRLWGRLQVTGLEALPESGAILLAGNHDSYWDPLVVGVAARKRRQVHALAKHSLWKVRAAGWVLDGMGQIPIQRGGQDAGALDAALAKLDEGACIGIFLEGTRTLGRELRARSGFGRLAEAHPEAAIVCVAIHDTTTFSKFPKRPRLRVEFFTPGGGGLQEGESAAELSERLLAEIRARVPIPT